MESLTPNNPENWHEALHAFEKIFGISNPLREGETPIDYYYRAGDLYASFREKNLESQIRGFVMGYFNHPPIETQLTLWNRVQMVFSPSMALRYFGIQEGYAIGKKAKVLLGME